MSANLSGTACVIGTALFLLLLREMILSIGKGKPDPDNARGAYRLEIVKNRRARGESENPVEAIQTEAAFIEANEFLAELRPEAQSHSANSR